VKPGKTGIARLIDATGYSIKGIGACWKHEAAFRQEVLLAVVLLPLSFFIAENAVQWLLLVSPLILLLIVELLNSAIENAVDRIGDEPHSLSGRAKDMGSAAVFFSLVLIGITWLAIAWQNFMLEGVG
jgi:diacylglycerol kinase (ATP)